ncbi:MAG: CcdB family protein [Pseudomonadota bacterium]
MDFHRAPGSTPGLIVEVQSDLLPYLPTRVVVPLVPRSDGPDPVTHLNPRLDINGTEYMLLPQYIGIVPVTALQSSMGNLADHQDTITRALDRLLTDI